MSSAKLLADNPVSFLCNAIVYRAAKKHWVSPVNNEVLEEAFYRRPLTHQYPDRKGLSVDLSPDAIKGYLKRPFPGFITLHVGWVRDLNLGIDVVPDSATKGNITGLPYRDDTDLNMIAEAERLARALKEIARFAPNE